LSSRELRTVLPYLDKVSYQFETNIILPAAQARHQRVSALASLSTATRLGSQPALSGRQPHAGSPHRGGPATPEVLSPRIALPAEDPIHLWWEHHRTRYVIWKAVEQSKVSSLLYTCAGLGISVLMLFVLMRYQAQVASLGGWGYPGVLLVELGNSATLFLPTPGHAYTFALAGSLNAPLVALFAAIGAATGELTGYMLGATGRQVLQKGRVYRRLTSLPPRMIGIILFVVAALPVPFDFAGIWAGAARYPVPRFLTAAFGGKVIKMLVIVSIAYLVTR
jgi:membrane protein YqaA with SNARE-associated domain